MTQVAATLLGIATVFSIGTQGGTPTYTAINGLNKISPPAGKFGTEDVTTFNSAGLDRVFVKTLRDPGEVSIEGEYESADPGQLALQTAFSTSSNSASGGAYPFKLVLPIDLQGGQTTTGDSFAFNALVTDWAIPDVEIDKVVTFKAMLKITGPVTATEGS
jgi:hypothetical protein